jgi:hypothetical protein
MERSFCQRPEAKKAPILMERRLQKPKPCVTLAPNRVHPNRANNVNVTPIAFHKAISN